LCHEFNFATPSPGADVKVLFTIWGS